MDELASMVPACLVVPFGTAALLMASERSLPRPVADLLAVASAVAVAILCSVLAASTTDAPIVTWLGGWTPEAGVPVGIALVVDPPAAALGALAGIFGAIALLISWRLYDAVGPLFHVLLLLLVGGAVVVAFAGDLFTLFVGLQLVGVASYALTGYQIESAAPIHGSFSFAILDSIASMLMLLGIALLYARAGALNLAEMATVLAGERADLVVLVAIVLVVVGLAAKAGVAPFHFARADAHTAAPTPALVAFSGFLLTVAVFSVARLHAVVFAAALGGLHAPAQLLFATSAAVGAVLLAVMCLLQHQLKRMLAFATMSHASLALIGVAAMSPAGHAGAGLYLAALGAAEAAAILVVGLLLHRHGSAEEHELHGKGRGMRWVGACWLAAAWAMLGLPPFASSVGRELVRSAWDAPGLGAAIAIASVLSAAAMLRVGARIFLDWGPHHGDGEDEGEGSDDAEADSEADAEGPSRASWWVPAAAAALLAFAAAVSALADPALQAARDFVDVERYLRAVAGGPAPGPPSSSTAASAPSLGVAPGDLVRAAAAVAIALAAVHGPRLPAPLRNAAALAGRPLRALRALHSGHVGDYLTWLVVGAAALGITAVLAAT